MTRTKLAALGVALIVAGALFAADVDKSELKLTAAQQAAIDKVKAAGGQVLRVAANTDALDVAFHLSDNKNVDPILPTLKLVPNVTKLNLSGTNVSDAALAQVGQIKTLTHLHLEKTKIGDAGVAQLKGLENLQYLNLYATQVTDKGLAQLKGLKNLKKLYVWQSKVTEAGAIALRKARPDMYVNTGWQSPPALIKPVRKPEPEPEPQKITIELVMKEAHKGDNSLLKRAIANNAKPDELKQLVTYYKAMADLKPPKGDLGDWKKKVGALLAAAEKLSKGDKSAAAALKTAANCKACHSAHRE